MLPPAPNLPPKNHYQTPQVQPQPARQEYRQHDEYSYQYPKYDEYQSQYAYQQNYGANSQPKIGRIQDYDPLSDGPRAPPNVQHASATLIYNSTRDAKQRGASQVPHQQQQQSRQIGRVTDMDPLAAEQPRPANNHHQATNQRVYIAMYDYEANDSDEVSFREGDYISNVTSIDEGWMTGEVLRTGRTGMLPANYVELAPAPPLHYAH